MNLVFFAHPSFLGSQSMPRFAQLLFTGMKSRGHTVSLWTPKARFFKLPVSSRAKKWVGYVDQFVIFPTETLLRIKACAPDTLFVFTDQGLGPWVPLVSDRPHIIHCHDFLAQLSALGKIPENPTAWTGRRYQELIRRGYRQGKHFISVSEKTREDLHQFLKSSPVTSEVVYNGMNRDFKPENPAWARNIFGKKFGIDLSAGYLLHIGGNQWYKNRRGVVEIYNAWRSKSSEKLPLLLIGKQADLPLQEAYTSSPFRENIHLLCNLEDEYVRLAYAGASLFLFPSLAEGFGWPVAEAMASGCPVITTNEAPMSVVAGNAGFLIPRRPRTAHETASWAEAAARVVMEVLSLPAEARNSVVESGLLNARRFNAKSALDQIERIYLEILQKDAVL